MAYQLIWSVQALDDIEAIAEFIARDSVFYAESTVEKIFDAVGSLKSYPRIGRVVPEIGKETIRELFVFQYRIMYEVQEQEIHILSVLHGKRLFEEKDLSSD